MRIIPLGQRGAASAAIMALAVVLILTAAAAPADEADRIRPYEENPFYWQYEGRPVLLLGGTDQDNLFNHPDSLEPEGLESHLDLLASVGGNYVRNTMSHRDAGNVFAFERIADGRFDLTRFNAEYFERFDRFLQMTRDRKIIVQIELWETWDHYGDHEPQGGWSRHPFNPKNNVNFTAEDAGLPVEIGFNPTGAPSDHTFFHTVPDLKNNTVVLPFQQALVDRILEVSFKYSHVLYCMNNETGEPNAWGEYWARYIRARAEQIGKPIEITDMRRSENLSSPDHRVIQDQPDLYTFIEVSQNNGTSRSGQNHWDPLMETRRYIADAPRPINNVKVYGGEGGWGGVDQGLQKFWRNLMAGCASVRFHRRFPAAGIGLTPLAQANLRSARMLTDAMTVFTCAPRNDLLSEREPNEAYCLAEPGRQYAVYFPNGGAVALDLSDAEGTWTIRWLNIAESRWTDEAQIEGAAAALTLTAPGDGHWAALVLPRS